MAEDGGIYGSGGLFDNENAAKPPRRRWRGGGESASNFDIKPGNSEDSADFARKYDPFGDKERSPNEPLGIYDRMELNRNSADAALRRQGMIDAQRRIKWHEVGKHVIPRENTWAAHARLVKDERIGVYFDANYYQYFDKIFAEKLGIDAVSNPDNPDYAKYEGLRTNFAVLRNALYAHYMKDGRYDPEDGEIVPKLAGIARDLGEALSADGGIGSVFFPSMSLKVANTEAVGAAAMYRYLLRQQSPKLWPEFLNNWRRAIGQLLRLRDHDWGLPPQSETPFSPEAMAAPPPRDALDIAAAAAGNQPAQAEEKQPTPQAAMLVASEFALDTAQRLRHVENLEVLQKLDAKTQEEAVDHAKEIIRWLRNLKFQTLDVQNWLDQGEPTEQAAKVEGITQLMMMYQDQLARLPMEQRMPLMRDPAIQEANDAAGGAALALGYHSLLTLKKDSPYGKAIEDKMVSLPERLEFERGMSAERLIEKLEAGLERIIQRRINERAPQARLEEMAKRTEKTVHRMRDVHTMDEPKRVESVELGREILRKLRNLQAAEKPIEEVIKENSSEENIKLAQKLDEAVDIYNNMLGEAAKGDPSFSFLARSKIKEASDAAGQASHAIKLMAAKEMPNSIAAAQQISADKAQMPEEWRKLNDRTVGRLVASMEGGLEEAHHAVEQQEAQEQQQDDELQQEIAESALQNDDLRKRRRRGRKRSSVSGMGGAKARKVAMDISADDYKLGQGRFARSGGAMAKRERQVEPRQPDLADALSADVRAAVDGMRGQATEWNNQLKDSPVNQPAAAAPAQGFNPAVPNSFEQGNVANQVKQEDAFKQSQNQQGSGSGQRSGNGQRSGSRKNSVRGNK